MSYPSIAITRNADQIVEDAIRQSPVDTEQYAIHRRALTLLVTPWLWCVAMPWLASGTLLRRTAARA